MPGLVLGIHVLGNAACKDVGGWAKPGHDVQRNTKTLKSEQE
jgi:hypothetical protein